jgi:hypothetical protein
VLSRDLIRLQEVPADLGTPKGQKCLGCQRAFRIVCETMTRIQFGEGRFAGIVLPKLWLSR